MRICSQHWDNDFKYSCATGVMMSTIGKWRAPLKYTPCDTLSLYPAACFRFKTPFFKNSTIPYPCAGLDNYHTLGCAFGDGYITAKCKKYNPTVAQTNPQRTWNHFIACAEGLWQHNGNISTEHCHIHSKTPAYEPCMRHTSPGNPKWNWELLEGLASYSE